jgi:hypothetical protein
MPQAVKNRRVTQGIRKNPGQRKNRSKQGCKGRTARTCAPAIISDSIFALTLGHKGGTEVYVKQSTDKGIGKDVEVLYNDLFASLKNAMLLITGEAADFNPRKFLSLDTSTDYLIRKFDEKIKPFGYDFKPSEANGEYFFTLYKECDNINEWNVFSICHVVRKLAKTYPQLHDLFIEFLKSFSCRTGIDFWYGDTVSYAEEWLDEAIANEEGEIVNDDYTLYDELCRTKQNYEIGEAYKYRNLLIKTEVLSTATITKKLEDLPKKHPVKELIKNGCAFLDEYNYHIWDFSHHELNEDYDNYGAGLRYEMQSCIMWDCADEYTARHEEMIDAEAQEGVLPPIVVLNIKKDLKSIDINWLKKADEFPPALNNFFNYACTILNKYEPKNRKSNSRL